MKMYMTGRVGEGAAERVWWKLLSVKWFFFFSQSPHCLWCRRMCAVTFRTAQLLRCALSPLISLVPPSFLIITLSYLKRFSNKTTAEKDTRESSLADLWNIVTWCLIAIQCYWNIYFFYLAFFSSFLLDHIHLYGNKVASFNTNWSSLTW